MEGLYFELLPEDLIPIILHKLYGTAEIYSLIEALTLNEEVYFHKVLGILHGIFKCVPYKCKVGTRFIKWEGCYTELLNSTNIRNSLPVDIIEWISDERINLCSVFIYDYFRNPTYRKLMSFTYIFSDDIGFRIIDNLIFCAKEINDIWRKILDYVKLVSDNCRPYIHRRKMDADGYVIWMSHSNDNIYCDGTIKNNELQLLTKEEVQIAKCKGYHVSVQSIAS